MNFYFCIVLYYKIRMIMEYKLPALPYAENALEPVISARTVSYHYGKHTKGYIENLNRLIAGTEYGDMPLEGIITSSGGAIFNNAAQAWNHMFYFEQFCKGGRGDIGGKLKTAVEKGFGSVIAFKELFASSGSSIFGSGWIWLAADKSGDLHIVKCSNADNPLVNGMTPLLAFDVWEHAYYLDFQNRRLEHLNALWAIVDWDVVMKRYENVLNG